MAESGHRVGLTVAYSPKAREVIEIDFLAEASASILQVLRACGLLTRCPELDLTSLTVSVWGRKASYNQTVREGDRIELCRPLLVDPKVARRERFARQGRRGTGLFAKRRTGKQAGY